MFCYKCGVSIPDDARFCTACGALAWRTKPEEVPEDRPPAPQPAPPPFNDYLIYSILTTVCCCMPLGIVAIIFSANSKRQFSAGDYAGAADTAKKARLLCIIGLLVGIILQIINIVRVVLMLSSGEIQKFLELQQGAGRFW